MSTPADDSRRLPALAEVRRQPQPPAAAGSIPELVLGYLDSILSELEALVAQEAGPKGTGTVAAAGRIAAPAAGAQLVNVPAPGAGRYRVQVRTRKLVDDALELNARLRLGGAIVAPLLTLTSSEDHELPELEIRQGQEVIVEVIAASAQTYLAFVSLTRVE